MKVFFHTSGCRVNQYETQYLKEGICSGGGFEQTDDPSAAGIAVINSCTVTHNADADCRQMMRRVIRANPACPPSASGGFGGLRKACRLIVTGCYAVCSREAVLSVNPGAEVIADKDEVIAAVTGRPPRRRGITRFDGRSKAFVKIQDGCDAFCSYCVVPLARPRLYSRPVDDVLNEAGELLKNDYREIVLCGIRLGKYGNGINGGGEGLASLMKTLLEKHPQLRLSLSSIELGDITETLAELMAGSDRVAKHLHIPLQSGDASVLRLMNRPYTPAEYLERINRLRGIIQGIEITTDVMVGFPGETEREFGNTIAFIKKCRFDKMHVFRFSPRPGTAAEKMCVQGVQRAGSAELKFRASVFRKTLTIR
jgi:threonylcarbamoyladenosine tRNA methylthiotransferase MtaB